jgi:Domain of unknown function (DUF4288)
MKTRRYSAKLLFQFRVMVDGSAGKRRICEERIITLRAQNAKAALQAAKKSARSAEHTYKNNEGNRVHFEFIGVLELLCLDPACDANEVWYEIVDRIEPMERKSKLIPAESKLNAIRNRE